MKIIYSKWLVSKKYAATTRVMGVVDRIIEERQLRKARREAVIVSIKALPLEDRQEVLIALVEMVGDITAGADEISVGEQAHAPQTFTARAEAFVLAHPGVKTSVVAKGIGQRPANAHQSLTNASRNRRKIERRDGKWFPVAGLTATIDQTSTINGQKPLLAEPTKSKSHRDLVCQVLGASKRPMGAGEIADAIMRIDPERNRGSLTSEVHRMRKDKPSLIIDKGNNGRGGLFVLANGGTHLAAD